MAPDDEIVFGRSLDESRAFLEQLETLSSEQASDLVFARAEFELHGATLRSLAGWYPDEPRVSDAVREWEYLADKA